MNALAYDVPADVVAVLVLPEIDGLAVDQTLGAACVWCNCPLPVATAVDLGEPLSPCGSTAISGMRWCARSCPSCVAERAHRGLYSHIPDCEQCTDDAEVCDVGRILYRLVRDHRR
ncbi:hypothetical protein ACIQAC_01195 [Streptomyces sp. NPDC088387]|uniref:hypothetical protein n=1 Tax=Streptomyces sp. NPDC088387 TaxID=3365859 RepID=UPI003824562E